MQQQFRKGDVISVPAIVEYDYPPARREDGTEVDDRGVYVKVSYTTVTFPPVEVKLVRPFYNPGDKVFVPESPIGESATEVEVLALHEDMVWVKEANGSTNVYAALDLVRTLEEARRE